jgi:predicted ABC-type ATPase
LKLPQTFDQRPLLAALAGPNGAGKTTFYHAHLKSSGLRFVNADVLALELGIGPYESARIAEALRRELVRRKESFVFETVFSDPVGEKLGFLQEAARSGYTTVLCFIGLQDPDLCQERVAMRVSQGGHEVPDDKLRTRFPRILNNLKAAIRQLPNVLVYDNSDLARPFHLLALFDHGRAGFQEKVLPKWLKPHLSH